MLRVRLSNCSEKLNNHSAPPAGGAFNISQKTNARRQITFEIAYNIWYNIINYYLNVEKRRMMAKL